MSISILAIAMLPFFAAPVWTAHLFHQTLNLERRQIAVDNGGIVLGGKEREALNFLVSQNQRLRVLEIEHHVMHLCARTPSIATPECLAADQALEAQILLLRMEALRRASSLWFQGEILAESEFRRLNVRARVVRPKVLPIFSTKCPVCGLEVFWERLPTDLSADIATSSDRLIGVRVSLVGRSLLRAEPWTYQLELSGNGLSL